MRAFRFKAFLDKLLWDRETHPEDIYRVKGALHVEGDARKHMVQVGGRGRRSMASLSSFLRPQAPQLPHATSPPLLPQAVYELYSIAPSVEWGEDEARVSRVVIIGRNLKRTVLEQWLEATQAAA